MEKLDGLNSLECEAGHNPVTWREAHVLKRTVVKEKLSKKHHPTSSCEDLGSQQAGHKQGLCEAMEKIWFQWKGKLSCFKMES